MARSLVPSTAPVLLTLLLAAGPVAAQSTLDARLADIFSGLDSAVPVQVVTPSFFVEDAYVMSVGNRSVGLEQDGTSVDIPFPDIRGVSVRDTHWLQGSLWGVGVGALVGGVGGLLWASFRCTDLIDCQTEERNGMVQGAVLLGSVGAIGGFVIGRNSFYWRPVFP